MPASVAFACLLLISGSARGQESNGPVFPATQWQQASPESQGVDSERLHKAVDYLKANAPHDGVKRLVIVRNGRIIWKGPEADRQQRVWSVTKAFTSTAHGLLIEDGKCSLDTLAKDYNPKLAEHYPGVTLRHLATMTSGIDGVGGSYDCDGEGRCDKNALVDPAPPLFPPGTKYQYWDEATQQYGFVLTKIAGEPLQDLLQRRILGPLGIGQIGWRQDDSDFNVPNWTGGLEIAASDLARFGLLFLHRGNWDGKQLISSQWVDAATSVQVPPSIPDALATSTRQGSGVYGYHWWPNGTRPDGTRRWPRAPHGTYGRSGHNNNDLFVLPAWNMVIVRLGLDERKSSGGFPLANTTYSEFFGRVGEALRDPVVEGDRRVWHPITVSFRGPMANESDHNPNPFLDYRLQVTFTGPSGQTYDVPGFFDGDGHGSESGDVWRVRFSPDEAGRWTFKASFRAGPDVAVSLDPNAGKAFALNGQGGEFEIASRSAETPGYLKWGRLEYVDEHYLKFKDGPYWIRGGTDSPENFLAYAGFDDTTPSHGYADHVADWRPGDPDWSDGKGRAIIGSLNYLASKHVNSIYFLTMNVGGDGNDVWPWLQVANPKGDPANDNVHFDISKLRQWNTVFDHAQRRGIFLHFVFNEAEEANKRELDDGELGTERKLYYRELMARFGHHLALEWNLCEEYNLDFDFGHDRIGAFADYVKAVDPYDHPITVHSARDPIEALQFTFGDERFSLTSIQLNQRRIDTLTEQFRKATAKAGHPLPVSMDEFTVDKGQEKSWLPVDDAERWRKEKLWPTYLSGGSIEFILGDLLETDSFKTPERDKLWDYVWYARRFLQDLPFHEMQPADDLLSGAASITVTQNRGRTQHRMGAQVFAKPGHVYAIYLPITAPSGAIDLSEADGELKLRWFNPRSGRFEGEATTVPGRPRVSIGSPPTDAEQDWVVLIRGPERTDSFQGLREFNPPAAAPADSVVAIVGATLVDGLGGPPVASSVVVVRGSRIVDVGTPDSATIPDNAAIVDASGLTLLPGLVDSHFHIGSSAKMYDRPPQFLQSGITTARDPGRPIEIYMPIRKSEEPMPRLFLTGPHFDQAPPAYPHNAVILESPEAAREAVHRYVDQGASAIKVYFRLPLDSIEATCDAAHQRGIPVTAHLELVDVDNAILAGLDGIEHITSCGTVLAEKDMAEQFRSAVDGDNNARKDGRYRLWAGLDLNSNRAKRLVKLLVENDVFVSPTLAIFERRPGDKRQSQEFHVQGFEKMLRFVGMCHDAGAVVVTGSHGSVPFAKAGFAFQREMELLVDSGLTPLEAITASTINNARFLGCADRLGSIEPGKIADIVLVDGKAHEDIKAMYDVRRVMLNGRWVRAPAESDAE